MTNVLLVEDNRAQAILARQALNACNGKYSLLTTATGAAGLAQDLEAVDIVLLDYSLPDMSGIDVLRGILSKKDMPVIMVTGEDSWSVIQQAIQSGASDYIVKIGNYFQSIPLAIDKNIEMHRLKKEREKMEESLKLRHLELEKAYADLKEAQTQILQSEKMVSIGHLAAGVAHEINTPIQYVGDNVLFLKDAFGQLAKMFQAHDRLLAAAKEGAVPPDLIAEVEAVAQEIEFDYQRREIHKAIEQSLEGVAHVAKIVQAMKEFSHPGTDEKVQIDLNHAIENTITVSRNEWKYVADMKTELDADLPPVYCLPGPFNQVILNIIVNAAHAIADVVAKDPGQRGLITVSTRQDGQWAEIRIRDTGTGIPEEVRPHIFDLFFTTKEVGKGTGQGLAVAHSVIIKQHGGTITLETEMSVGTTFIIRLPIDELR